MENTEFTQKKERKRDFLASRAGSRQENTTHAEGILKHVAANSFGSCLSMDKLRGFFKAYNQETEMACDTSLVQISLYTC